MFGALWFCGFSSDDARIHAVTLVGKLQDATSHPAVEVVRKSLFA
ncbi:hypothetical protein M7I_3609 [Glarea lozoyensis 74030]|uniref:Uncharacterized protein n=1 Tax=Glarea lozoyensis (strain ATCC 74030 / MF5533) TaxID=1104152 RepID=H0ELY4_GLAL7|nr:hypothetical protein M7I_3609 [Glarea lozoyensis 74030]